MGGKKSRRRIHSVEYLQRELDGVLDFIADLERRKGRVPEAWRKGMLRHYRERRDDLRSELKELTGESARPRTA